jgi:hypothetical protein
MNDKRAKKVMRSKSPANINAMFHSALTPQKPKGNGKSKIAKKNIVKNKGMLNISKISGSSNKTFFKCRSTHSLPRIPGDDLKMIKQIFEQAKKYRETMGTQKIPVKIMPKQKSKFLHPPRARSIPKMKHSSNTVNSLHHKIGKFCSIGCFDA